MARQGSCERACEGEGRNIDETEIVASAVGGPLTSTKDSGHSGIDQTSSLDRSLPSNKTATASTVDGCQDDYSRSTSRLDNGKAQGTEESFQSSWPVMLYVPNLLGYLRITLSFFGLKCALRQQRDAALNIWIAAALLDLIDGPAARKLQQCSQFGILLDIVADNILRTIVWISAMIESSKSDPIEHNICLWAIAIVCLEWITMFCSQNNADQYTYWKRNKSRPSWVQAVFKNNFRTLPGIFAIYGLFVAPFGTYVWYADRLRKTTWPSRLLSERNMSIIVQTTYAGRCMSAMVELWLCYEHLRDVIELDRSHWAKQKDP